MLGMLAYGCDPTVEVAGRILWRLVTYLEPTQNLSRYTRTQQKPQVCLKLPLQAIHRTSIAF